MRNYTINCEPTGMHQAYGPDLNTADVWEEIDILFAIQDVLRTWPWDQICRVTQIRPGVFEFGDQRSPSDRLICIGMDRVWEKMKQQGLIRDAS